MTSSLHGDEVNGVRVIHRLFQTELDPEQLHGTVVAVIVANVEGFLAGTRGMEGQDLNRLMPGYKKFLPTLTLENKQAPHHSNTHTTSSIAS
jgi:predicted deacylase